MCNQFIKTILCQIVCIYLFCKWTWAFGTKSIAELSKIIIGILKTQKLCIVNFKIELRIYELQKSYKKLQKLLISWFVRCSFWNALLAATASRWIILPQYLKKTKLNLFYVNDLLKVVWFQGWGSGVILFKFDRYYIILKKWAGYIF